jgi:PilZ domain
MRDPDDEAQNGRNVLSLPQHRIVLAWSYWAGSIANEPLLALVGQGIKGSRQAYPNSFRVHLIFMFLSRQNARLSAMVKDHVRTIEQEAMDNEREHRRTRFLKVVARCPGGEPMAAVLKNISSQGLAIDTQLRAEVDDKVEIRLPYYGWVSGEVRWNRKGRLGVQLADPVESELVVAAQGSAAPFDTSYAHRIEALDAEPQPEAPPAPRRMV